MLSKLLKHDLKKNMRWLWILFVATIVIAGIARGFKELGNSIAFFKILGIIFESLFYTLAINCIIQPFLRSFLFSTSIGINLQHRPHFLHNPLIKFIIQYFLSDFKAIPNFL